MMSVECANSNWANFSDFESEPTNHSEGPGWVDFASNVYTAVSHAEAAHVVATAATTEVSNVCFSRRRAHEINNGLYYAIYNSIQQGNHSELFGGHHLSNEEWHVQRQRRELRQERRRKEEQRDVQRRTNGMEVVYRHESTIEPVATTRREIRFEQGHVLLEHERTNNEATPATREQTPAPEEPEARPSHRRRARRAPLTREAQRERLYHLSSTIMHVPLRLLDMLRCQGNGSEEPITTWADQDQLNQEVEQRERAMADISGGRGWIHGLNMPAEAEEDEGSEGTRYWSTGTAMESDWDSDDSSVGSEEESIQQSVYVMQTADSSLWSEEFVRERRLPSTE